MTEITVFDLTQVSTVVSFKGTVHISEFSGLETLCGRKFKFGSDQWLENHEDRQPSCKTCCDIAYRHPVTYPFHRLVRPL